MPLAPIDLLHAGVDRSIGCYLIETRDGPALFDCGAATTVTALLAALDRRGLALTEVRHLLLSHIHLDHAGAAGALVELHPGLQVHVSEIGAPHLVDPTRLEASARRLYGDAFDTLWGPLTPVPAGNVHVVGGEACGLAVFPTPGHAAHHVSYFAPDGTLFSGDAAGVRVAPGRFVLPPLPPPEIDLEAWERTIALTERLAPERLALIHFGVFDDVDHHLGALRTTIASWSARVEAGVTEDAFVAAARADAVAVDGDDEHLLSRIVPYWHCYRGLERYHRKRREQTTP